MNFPAELKYSKSHEWVKMLSDNTALVGITDYAQSELGDLVFINLPVAGDSVTKSEAFCDVESVKAVSDVISPVTGVVAEANEALMPLMKGLFETSNPILVKEALSLVGFPVGGVRLPLVDATPEQSARRASIMREVGVLD